MKKKKKQQHILGIERLLFRFCIVIMILLIVGIVCGQTTLAQINLEVQKLNKEVSNQRNKNESLEMKIDEMTSLDRVKEISSEYGLSYNSENIKTIK